MEAQENNESFHDLLRTCLPKDVVRISFKVDYNSPYSTFSPSPTKITILLQRRIPLEKIKDEYWDIKADFGVKNMPNSFFKYGRLNTVRKELHEPSAIITVDLEYTLFTEIEYLCDELKKEFWHKYSDEFNSLLENTLSSKVE